jgi:hypothetical protein
MLFAKGDLNAMTLVAYIGAQVLGGLLALAWYKASSKKSS